MFNWLFARHCGGKFLLRIEDTDKRRSTAENIKSIFGILKWLKIDWDDEPVIQSARIERHREVANCLVEEGTAYYCYCSQEELAAKKKRFEDPESFTSMTERAVTATIRLMV
jgi:glutamyl-tRNA synthetase